MAYQSVWGRLKQQRIIKSKSVVLFASLVVFFVGAQIRLHKRISNVDTNPERIKEAHRRRFQLNNATVLQKTIQYDENDTRDTTKWKVTTTTTTKKHILNSGSAAIEKDRKDPPPVYWSKARNDRSGSTILDMIRADAYTFHHNMTYGGACLAGKRRASTYRRQAMVVSMLEEIGLDRVIKYACPTNLSLLPQGSENDAPHSMFATSGQARWAWFTNEWKEHFFSRWNPTIFKDDDDDNAKNKTKKNLKEKTVVVHIRRGDVHPCKYPERYNTNSHYLRLLDEYVTLLDNAKVYVYSQSESYEPLDDFFQRNYTMMLDTDLIGVFKALITADVAIISKSTFAIWPALLNRRGVVISSGDADAWEPHPDWITPPKDMMEQSAKDLLDLKQRTCLGVKPAKYNYTKPD